VNSSRKENFFSSKVLGHPAGLFVLFFTEMWERFSYYGMRALLVLFLVSSFGLGGWNWSRENALALYGTYTSLVYIMPILGGYIADKYIGYRWAVVIGAIVMILGHASMAMDFHHIFLYIGIGLLIIGNGFFKPNIISIISHMYKDIPEKKDSAYTIFYMGVSGGAFLGILLCGYLGEKVGWSYGFGLAGIFMFFGMLQFYFTQKILGSIGEKPHKNKQKLNTQLEFEGDRLNPFNRIDFLLIILTVIIAITWVINDPLSKISGINLLEYNETDYSNSIAVIGLTLFFILLIYRITRYPKITRDRMTAIIFFAIMTIVFWMSFEQAGGTMNIFAKDYTHRIMVGNYYYIYITINTAITLIPILITTWLLFKLLRQTFHKYKIGNLFLGFSFLIIWGIVFWIIRREYNSNSYEISYQAIQTHAIPSEYSATPARLETFKNKLLSNDNFLTDQGPLKIDSIRYNDAFVIHKVSKKIKKSEKAKEQKKIDEDFIHSVFSINDPSKAIVYFSKKGKVKTIALNQLYFQTPVTEETAYQPNEKIIDKKATLVEPISLKKNEEIKILNVGKKDAFVYLNTERETAIRTKSAEHHLDTRIIHAKISRIKESETEIPATWFLILNPLFLIIFAPLFSKLWNSKYNLNANGKYALGLILLGAGFGMLAFGASEVPSGAKTASVSLIWLVLAYLFHPLSELCISPVGLSYISKLVPGRMIAMMFGVWLIAVAIGNKLAGLLGSKIDEITSSYNMTTFFSIFTIVPIILGLISIALAPIIKKRMHGIK